MSITLITGANKGIGYATARGACKTGALDLTGSDAETMFGTNVVGIVRVIHAFLPLLVKSQSAEFVNVSSGMGSFGVTHAPDRVRHLLSRSRWIW